MSAAHTPELLSPAGNWDCARAAVASGADAIYFGMPRFNARLRADNFTEDDLPGLMEFLHRHGVRGFVAMNTLIFTGELADAERQLRLLAAAKVDAIIVQDLGLARLASKVAPTLELHASTQMTISSPEGLAFLESVIPLERAVLARELSVKEIGKFHLAGGPVTPLEVFVHGALCVAYSGQCLTSESLGQRSANRGECAQACRMPYELVVDGVIQELGEVRYLLSPQDLAAVDLIPELVRAGVKSYKIEGRLKSPEYVTAVTRVYRKALDAAIAESAESPVTAEDRYALEMTFSRGLSSGWLAGTNHPLLTHGRFGKKRGALLGTITEVGAGWVALEFASEIPVKAGDGVVFDAGEDRNDEQGGRVWRVEENRLHFHARSGIFFPRIEVGQRLWKTSDPALESELRKAWQNARPAPVRSGLDIVVTGRAGAPLVLTVGDLSVASVELLDVAQNRPLTSETLAAQLGRLGDTAYELGEITNQLEGEVILPVSALNRLRRALVAELDAHGAATPAAAPAPPSVSVSDFLPARTAPDAPPAPHLGVLCRDLRHVEAALVARVGEILCDFEDPRRYKDAVALVRAHPAATATMIALATPRILKPGESGYLKLIERAEPDAVLIRNLGAIQYYQNRTGLRKLGDFSLNVANPLTARLLVEDGGLDRLTISYDLNIGQVLELLAMAPPAWFELTLHQHMPLFHMEHCVFCTFMSSGTTYKDCGRPCESHKVQLRDRVGQLHTLHADVGCRNTLFNGRAQSGARFFPALRKAGLANFRIELLGEDKPTAIRTIRAYQDLLESRTSAADLIHTLSPLDKLGVIEGTLA
jgi:putative protease